MSSDNYWKEHHKLLLSILSKEDMEPSSFTKFALNELSKLAVLLNRKLDILELGFGLARDINFWVDYSRFYAALDISETAVQYLETISLHLKEKTELLILCKDIRQGLPLNGCTSDIILSNFVFNCDFSLEELDFIFSECHRVLRKNASSLFCFSVRSTDDPTYLNYQKGAGLYSFGDTRLHFFSKKYLQKCLKNYFRILEIIPVKTIISNEIYSALFVKASLL